MIYITVPELARQHGVTRAAVHLWIAQTPGLRLRRTGRAYLLTEADVAAILSRPRKKIGRPRKK
jgi:hypothetical protein